MDESPRQMHHLNYLVIEGNIGAGKTSLASMIAERHNARLILEQFEDNPFLPKFYREPERYAFPLELSFLAARYQQLHRELNPPDLLRGFTVADYFFSKSLIFARITLQPDEYKLYYKLFRIIQALLPRPDLYVYLHVSVDQLLENIRERGRSYEGNIQADYLVKVQEGYLKYLRSLKDYRILILDINQLDFVSQPAHYHQVEKAIFDTSYPHGISHLQLF